MNFHLHCLSLAAGLGLLIPPPLLTAQEKKDESAPPPAELDPQALVIIKRASEFLAKAPQFSTTAEVSQDFLDDKGTKLQLAKKVAIRVRRPDRLLVDISTTTPKRSFWYDGKTITLLDHRNNFYGVAPAPNKIDSMVEHVEKAIGVVFPLDDLVLSKPLADTAVSAKGALYLGREKVLDKTCHHLAFQHEAIDWQAWVEDGPKPLLRKVVITFKLDEGSPQFSALLTGWDLSTKLPDYLFQFEPPPGARQIEMRPGTGNDAKPEPEATATATDATPKAKP